MTEQLRVLILEDRPGDADLMVQRLEDEGFDPRWVRVETEAAYVAELEATPDLILAAWSAARFSGLQALHAVRGRGLDIPFVIVSGSVGDEVAVEALHEGADDYVLKDRLARLGPAVRRAVEGRRLREEQRWAESGLQQAAVVFESTTEGVTLTDLNGTIVAVNRAFVEITGYSAEEAVGRNPRILQSGRHDETFYRDLWATVSASGSWRGEIWNRRKNGELYPLWLTISAVKDEDGHPAQYVGVFSDIGDVKRAQEQLDHLAHHDALTGLPNRALLRDRLEQALRRAHHAHGIVGVVLLDIDRFGRVNDGLGHGVGDGLLQAVAARIADNLGAGDTLARYVADKFVIVAEDVPGATRVAHLARENLDRLAMPFDINGREVIVTCSAGISLYPADGTDAATLLHLSDAAMRQARVRGGNTIAFLDAGLANDLEEHLELERLLKGAAARNELVVHYQPQVDLADRSLAGVEALVRWQHPIRGLVAPGEFIPLAEEAGIIDEIGEWVLRESCRQMAAWQLDGFAVPRVAVNLSAQQLEREDLAQLVLSVLDDADIGPERLELEVTESTIMRQAETAATVLADLRRLNVELVMDDFGTGYSSLAQLRHLPLRRLKIDISFVRDIGDPTADAIVRAIIAMARSLGLQVVGEGVEREDQAAFLREAGCDIGQGYLFGRPVLPDVLREAWRP